MTKSKAEAVSFSVDPERRVSGLLVVPVDARAVYVLAHGAGAGMTHPFLAEMAEALAERGIATLRYQFPYMEKGGRRPDSPAVAQATVRAAVAEAGRLAPHLPLVAGGKSFGGRMTSAAAAAEPLAGVVGIAFLGFPLHTPGKPGDERGDHLFEVTVPMLFVQGTRDEFAELALLESLVKRLGRRATIHLVDEANHSFRVPAKTGRRPADILGELADTLTGWFDAVVGGDRP
jgi:predicted alpha/beta-hydrolase family hydrolase